jgi:hypothetical protein
MAVVVLVLSMACVCAACLLIGTAVRRGPQPLPTLNRTELVTLALAGDGGAIATLLDIHRPYDLGSRVALIRVLCAVRPEHDAWFGPDRQASMARLISRGAAWDDPGLALAVLGALQHVGSGRVLDAVQRLAFADERDVYSSVQIAALNCLPVLEERVRTRNASAALLRPSESPAPDLLLHPVQSLSPSNDSLLIASNRPGF